jgi:Protein of unknown function (DUF2933)
MHHDPSSNGAEPTPFWHSRYAVGLLVMGAIAAYFLLSEHRAHFVGALPLLLLLSCPLMHVFMHHGHGGHGDGHAHCQGGEPRSPPSTTPSKDRP